MLWKRSNLQTDARGCRRPETNHLATVLPLVVVTLVMAAALPLFSQTARIELSGTQEVPAVATGASGSCTGIYEGEGAFSLRCEHNLAGAIAAHIHSAVRGMNGPVLVPLGDGKSPISARTVFDAAATAELLTGGFYVNVHSAAHPPGELRGQIFFQPDLGATTTSFTADAGQEVPAGPPGATARCRLDGKGSDFHLVCTHNVSEPIAAHLHNAPRGQNGGVVVPLGDGASPIDSRFTLDANLLAELRAGNLYLNVHSTGSPPGEIRGQIDGCFADDKTLCLGDRFSARVAWMSPSATGTGDARPVARDSGSFSFFGGDNREILIKALNGCGINNRFWVFAAATTNVEYDLVVTDTSAGVSKTYSNPLGMKAEAVQDTSAFATCP